MIMKKIISITIDEDVFYWLLYQDINVSGFINSYLREVMECDKSEFPRTYRIE